MDGGNPDAGLGDSARSPQPGIVTGGSGGGSRPPESSWMIHWCIRRRTGVARQAAWRLFRTRGGVGGRRPRRDVLARRDLRLLRTCRPATWSATLLEPRTETLRLSPPDFQGRPIRVTDRLPRTG